MCLHRAYVLAAFFLLSSAALKSQTSVWVKSQGGASVEKGGGIALDAAGNIYIAGSFSGTADFDPGSGTFNITSNGGTDIFIQKLDNAGNLIWVKTMGGSRDDHANSIGVDLNGNVFATGFFRDTVDFNPGTGTDNLITDGFPPTQGYQDIFTLKLNSSGEFLWAYGMGTPYSDEVGRSLKVDTSGNVYTLGLFYGTMDVDPGPGVVELTLPIFKTAMFIQKLDNDGVFIWATWIYGAGYSIAVDEGQNVYSTGYFSDTTDFDPGPDTFYLETLGWPGSDVFTQKLNAAGDFVWAKSISGVDSYQYGYAITVDPDGNVLTTGVFEDTADFDPGPGVFNLISGGFGDVFIQKLDSAGSFVWAKAMGGSEHARGVAIDSDADGNVYTIGELWVSGDFDPGTGSFLLTSEGGSDVFIQKLDAAGNFLWAQAMGGNSDDLANSIAVNGAGESYTIGQYQEAAYFYLGSGPLSLVSEGQHDIFIQKLGAVLGISDHEEGLRFKIFPNPATNQISIEIPSTLSESLSLKIINLLGEEVYHLKLPESHGLSRHQVDLSNYSKGLYFLTISTEKGLISKKVLIQ